MGSTKPMSPAWTERELEDPHAQPDKHEKVRGMFGAIARRYDLNNRLHSFGRDQAWRRFAVGRVVTSTTRDALDAACGTGDLTEALARAGVARVVGLDFTPEMLERAREKQRRLPAEAAVRVEYIEGDAMSLPFPDSSFDVVTIAFGIRNVADPARAVGEFSRVLRPGGRLAVLEFDQPRQRVLRALNRLYAGWIMPMTATLIARDRSGAYRYLPRSVSKFMDGETLAALMARSGFSDVRTHRLTFGVCACHVGIRTG